MQGRLIHAGGYDGDGALAAGDGVSDADVCDSADDADFARFHRVLLDFFQPFVDEGSDGFAGSDVAVAVDDGYAVVGLDAARVDASDAEASAIFVKVQAGDEHLEGGFRVAGGLVDVLDDGVEQGQQVGSGIGEVEGGDSLPRRGVDDGKIELLFGGSEFGEEVEGLVYHPVGAGVGAVNFVDDDDGAVSHGEGFAGDEAGLGHGAVYGVHEQKNAVYHRHDALDFAAEIGVSGGVHDVDFVIEVGDGGIFADDGDAAFALDVV